MKTFLTFSSKAFKRNKKSYLQIAKILEELGLVIDYRWFENLEESTNEVYQRSFIELKNKELFIAEVSNPSVGVGLQIEMAKRLSKNIIILSKLDDNQSNSLISTLKGRKIFLIKYKSYNELKDKVEKLLPKIKSSDLEKLNFITTKDQKKFLLSMSKKLHISQSELLRQIIDDWIRRDHEKS